MVSKARGMMPLKTGSLATPLIVKVLPVPVWPYAKIVPLYPWITFSQMVKAVSAKTLSYSEFQSYTESNVKTFGTSSPGFCTKTSPVSGKILTALHVIRKNLPLSAISNFILWHRAATNPANEVIELTQLWCTQFLNLCLPSNLNR